MQSLLAQNPCSHDWRDVRFENQFVFNWSVSSMIEQGEEFNDGQPRRFMQHGQNVLLPKLQRGCSAIMKAKVTVTIAPPAEPQTPEEWQNAIDAADALLHIQSAEAYGLITGAPHVNIERCEQLLEAARRRGVTPGAGNVERYVAAYNEGSNV